jgi:hypothetical protein
MKRVQVRIEGSLPLVMHSPTLLDPLHPLTKQYKAISQKRKKTDQDYLDLYELEFRAGLYFSTEDGVYVPADNLLACMRDGAKRSKNGANVERCVFFTRPRYPLLYSGPRTVESLYSDENFRLIKVIRTLGGGSCMRCRPMFKEWAVEFQFVLDESVLALDVCKGIWRDAGLYQGFMDERPNFGRFELKSFTAEEMSNGQ